MNTELSWWHRCQRPIYYGLAWCLSLIMKMVGYRRSVIDANLALAFPDIPKPKRTAIRQAFYRNLADVIVETFRAHSLSEHQLRQVVKVIPSPAYRLLQQKGGIILTAHLANWEWAGLRVGLDLKMPHYVVYLPLRNRLVDQLIRTIRERFGNQAVPVKRITRRLLEHRDRPFVASFLADQNPPPPDIQAWYPLFKQMVPIHMGAERLARRLNVPIYWAYTRRIQRGSYVVDFECLAEYPADIEAGVIMAQYIQRLEAVIQAIPEQWLWSHRRWKLHPPT